MWSLILQAFFWTFSRNKFQQKVGDILSFWKISLSFLKKSLSFFQIPWGFFENFWVFSRVLWEDIFKLRKELFKISRLDVNQCPLNFKFQIPNLTWKDLTNLSLFVFSINGLKQNARSLLTPVSHPDFYALSHGSLHFGLYGS